MEKYSNLFVVLFFIVVVPIALYLILMPIFQQRKLLNGVINYDAFMRKFVFKVDFTKKEFYSKLENHSINDVLQYVFDEESSVVTFTKYNAVFCYKIRVEDINESIILRVEQISTFSRISYFINEFFIKKFDAKPLDFQNYGF